VPLTISRPAIAVRVLCGLLTAALLTAAPERPRAGKVEILKAGEVKRGMQAIAWTVFEGSEPEPVPIEIIGLWKNAWGPRQDIILGKMGGKAQRTNVAGGMSGSPVYVDGKLIGAVALRMSIFSPDAICGITPIELMLEINDFDQSRPAAPKVPGTGANRARLELPDSLAADVMNAPASARPVMVPIETPLTFSGFSTEVLSQFRGYFEQLGITAAQGGAAGSLTGSKPVAGYANALLPGDAVTGVLVSGDMSITGLGTVSYNDGRRVLAFGHPFFNLGPVEMPMSKGEILMVLSSQFQPNKFGNATEIVGALKQDRHSGIMGVLGAEAATIPVRVKVRSRGENDAVVKEKNFRFDVFVQQKWTPFLMMMTLFNSVSGVNDFSDDATYRLSGKVDLDGYSSLSLQNMQAPTEIPIPPPMVLANWWGEKFNRLFANPVKPPRLKGVEATIDLLPARRSAAIESAWIGSNEVEAGAEVPVRIYLRPYRGTRIEREVRVRIPAGIARGEHRILVSDADTLNRVQSIAGQTNRFIDLTETVSLINQERSNNRLYVSLVETRPAVYYDDKVMPGLPSSILNAMQTGRASSRALVAANETAVEQASLAMDQMVTGSYSLRVAVR